MRSTHATLLVIALIVAAACRAKAQAPSPEITASQVRIDQPPQIGEKSVDPSTRPQGTKDGRSLRGLAALKKSGQKPEAEAAIWVGRGDALMQQSRESLDGRLYAQAESAYLQALALDRENEEAMVGLAWVYNSEHSFDAGKEWAGKALARNPRLAHAYALLGDAAVELGDYDDALEHYQKALDIRPDLSSYSRAAHLLWLTGDTRKARWLMNKAIAAGGTHAGDIAWCRAELALLSFQDGALLPAERQAEIALQEAPTNHHVLAVMGRIKMAKKEYATAIKLYQRSIDLTPNHDSLVALGDLYALTDRPEQAEEQYKRVVALQNSATNHSHGGGVHSHGDAQLARFYADHDRNLKEALRQAELAYATYKNVFVADTLAWCYYQNGEYEKARRAIRKALQHNTPDASLLYHAGMIYSKTGESGAAQKYLYQALSLNPNFHPRHPTTAAETLKALAALRSVPKPEERPIAPAPPN